jgi:hypothetical protein
VTALAIPACDACSVPLGGPRDTDALCSSCSDALKPVPRDVLVTVQNAVAWAWTPELGDRAPEAARNFAAAMIFEEVPAAIAALGILEQRRRHFGLPITEAQADELAMRAASIWIRARGR